MDTRRRAPFGKADPPSTPSGTLALARAGLQCVVWRSPGQEPLCLVRGGGRGQKHATRKAASPPVPAPASPGTNPARMGTLTGQGLVGRLLHTAELLLHRGHGVGSGVPAGQLPARFLTLSPGLASPGIGVGGWNWASAAAHLGHSVQAEDPGTRRVHRSAQLPAWSRRTPAGGDRGTAWAAASEPPNQITSQAVPTELMGQGGTGHSGASGGWKYPKSP